MRRGLAEDSGGGRVVVVAEAQGERARDLGEQHLVVAQALGHRPAKRQHPLPIAHRRQHVVDQRRSPTTTRSAPAWSASMRDIGSLITAT